MALTQADLEAQLTTIQTKIAAAIANPSPNWRVGQVSFDQKTYLESLYEAQNMIIKQLRSIPSQAVDSVQNQVGPFGNDATEFYGEDY